MKHLIQFTSLVLLLLVFNSCSSEKKGSIEKAASAFINENDQVILFGSIDMMSILNKAEYKSVPKFGNIIDSQVKRMKSGLNLETGVYFAMEGPFEGRNPGTVYVFAEVKNLDSLKSVLMKDGYDFDTKEGIDYFRDGDAAVGIKNNVAILFVKSGEFDEFEMTKQAFEYAEGSELSGTGAKMLAQKGDISINSHMYNQFVNANNKTTELPKDKMDQLKDMMKESFSQANIHFENGQLRIAMDNQFSANLTKRIMFNEDAAASIRNKIGAGEPKMAISTNLDLGKLQTWLEDFAPEVMEQMTQDQMIGGGMMMAGGKISNVITGTMAFAMFGDPKAGAMVPDFNFFLGLGPNGEPIANMAKSFGSMGTMEMEITKDGIYGASSKDNVSTKGNTVTVPEGCETFGKKGLTGFINLEKMDTEALELEGAGKLVELVKYMNFAIDGNGGEILVKTKNSKENVLKQAVEHMLKEFEGQIGELSI